MRAARLHEYTDDVADALVVETVEDPVVSRPDDVLVRIAGSGWCRTDHKVIQGAYAHAGSSLPQILGHEPAGTVAAVGDGVVDIAEGETVVVHGAITCGQCRACRLGDDFHCDRLEMPGITTDGAFAEYLVVPERSVVATDLDPVAAAPYADAGLTAYGAATAAADGLVPGDVAVVIGIGGVGEVAVQCLRELTPARVVAVDVRAAALERATAVGADHAVDADEDDPAALVDDLTGGRGAARVLDCAGTGETFAAGLDLLGARGVHHVVGYGGEAEVPLQAFVERELAVEGHLVGTVPELQELLWLAETGAVEVPVATHDLAAVGDVAAAMERGEVTGRAVLVP
jgi:propanol-preferring alcohol dehydrogenase/NAD+-dependent secondary alcohol dehydrogenase Adh1